MSQSRMSQLRPSRLSVTSEGDPYSFSSRLNVVQGLGFLRCNSSTSSFHFPPVSRLAASVKTRALSARATAHGGTLDGTIDRQSYRRMACGCHIGRHGFVRRGTADVMVLTEGGTACCCVAHCCCSCNVGAAGCGGTMSPVGTGGEMCLSVLPVCFVRTFVLQTTTSIVRGVCPRQSSLCDPARYEHVDYSRCSSLTRACVLRRTARAADPIAIGNCKGRQPGSEKVRGCQGA
jgi:hypothetical protein